MAERSFLVRRQLALWYDVIGRDVAYAARLIRKEIPRLCRGGSHRLTFEEVCPPQILPS
jgi:hypothetical protein